MQQGSLAQTSKPQWGEEGIHMGWGLEDEIAAVTLGGCQNPNGTKSAFAWGKGATLARGDWLLHTGKLI